MISVTNAFKTAVKSDTKTVYATLTDGVDPITESDDLANLKIYTNGDFARTAIRQAECTFYGTHDYLDKEVNLRIGVELADTSIEYIDFGDFTVKESKDNNDVESTTIKMYDPMYDALQSYDLGGITFPVTLLSYLQSICTRLGWTLGTTSFFNDDLEVEADYFRFKDKTFRDALNRICEATGTVMYFDGDNELILKDIDGAYLETLDVDLSREMKIESQFGAVNSLVLSKQPENDNVWEGGYFYDNLLLESGDKILQENGTSFIGLEELQTIDDIMQVVFINNPILEQDREGYVSDLKTELEDLDMYPFEVKTIGLGYFELGDIVRLEDRSSNTYDTIIYNIEIEVGEVGFKEKIYSQLPSTSAIAIQEESGAIKETVRRTEIVGGAIRDNTISSAKISSLDASKITTGTLAVGESIIISDEFGMDRILIGYQEDGF